MLGHQQGTDVNAYHLRSGEHAVHFYRTNSELADRAGAYLEASLSSGGIAIAIATEPHLEAIGARLTAAGVAVDRLIEDGRLILLDAQATLAKLIIDGRVNPQAFERVVGRTIRVARRRGSALAAYGEMVDVLWQAGDVQGAIELEMLWNQLMAEVPFSLLCAYHSAAVAGPEHDDPLRVVCQLHSSVSSALGADPIAIRDRGIAHEASRDFQPMDSAPRAARRFVEDALRRWGHDGSAVDDARLLVSELVTNAVIHTRSPFSVSLESQPSRLRLAVHDESSAVPRSGGQKLETARGGRGLQIVAALADDWGVMTTPAGKTVWAELSAL